MICFQLQPVHFLELAVREDISALQILQAHDGRRILGKGLKPGLGQTQGAFGLDPFGDVAPVNVHPAALMGQMQFEHVDLVADGDVDLRCDAAGQQALGRLAQAIRRDPAAILRDQTLDLPGRGIGVDHHAAFAASPDHHRIGVFLRQKGQLRVRRRVRI